MHAQRTHTCIFCFIYMCTTVLGMCTITLAMCSIALGDVIGMINSVASLFCSLRALRSQELHSSSCNSPILRSSRAARTGVNVFTPYFFKSIFT